MHFCPFSELFPFLLENKISDLIFFLFCLTKQLRYTTYGLEICYSYLRSIKLIFPWLNKLFPYRR